MSISFVSLPSVLCSSDNMARLALEKYKIFLDDHLIQKND